MEASSNITKLIKAHHQGDKSAFDRVVQLLEPELRVIAHAHLARVGGGGTLSTTAVVNEAYLKLVDAPGATPESRSHFLAIAAKTMRNLLIDYARSRQSDKRGGAKVHVNVEDSNVSVEDQAEFLLQLDRALRALEGVDEKMVQVFECRYFAGLTDRETAQCLDIPLRTAQRCWMKVKAYLVDHFG